MSRARDHERGRLLDAGRARRRLGLGEDRQAFAEGAIEKLREAIIEKNRLYFHRWRPQNETYLFGFRKHEQGQNAREIPLFDPLVEAKEKEIAKLRRPVPHTYQLDRVTDRPEKKR